VKSALEQIAEVLSAHGVDFLVIGGQAELLQGSSRVTYDTDLCYRRSADNLKRLADALQQIHPKLRDAPDVPFRLDAEALGLGCNYTFQTDLGDLDLFGHVEPLGTYEQILPHAETYRIGDVSLRVIGLEDLIRIKEYLGRPKDRQALVQLQAIKRVREQQGQQGG